MALNLLKSGYKLTIWTRTTSACQPLVNAGATLAASPAEVCASSQVTFAMVSTPEAALLCAEAALSGLGPGKGYVDFTTMDAKTSRDIFTKVRSTGAQYLEAPVSGSKGPAEQGNLIFLVSSFHTYSGRRHVTGGPSFPFVSIFLSSPYKVLEATDAVRRFLTGLFPL
jgi:glyoxylate/succinic semialdehyde reductase